MGSFHGRSLVILLTTDLKTACQQGQTAQVLQETFGLILQAKHKSYDVSKIHRVKFPLFPEPCTETRASKFQGVKFVKDFAFPLASYLETCVVLQQREKEKEKL